MKKLKLDFDNTFVNSTKSFVDVHNIVFSSNARWDKVKRYDFKDEIPNLTSAVKHGIFGSPLFFEKLEFYDDAKNIINRIAEKTQVEIISMCAYETVERKGNFIKEHLPKAKFQPIIYPNFSDKSHIDMRNSVFIDDVEKNLHNCSADHTICFKYQGITQDINDKWNGDVLTKWDEETYKYLMYLLQGGK